MKVDKFLLEEALTNLGIKIFNGIHKDDSIKYTNAYESEINQILNCFSETKEDNDIDYKKLWNKFKFYFKKDLIIIESKEIRELGNLLTSWEEAERDQKEITNDN